MKKILLFLFMCCLCCGCGKEDKNITYIEAKEKIINNNAVLVDVRTQDEYDNGHIEGAILYSIDDISEDTVSTILDDKDKEIILYCQSGNRSSQAKEKLEELGYTNVYDLGAMSNWEE